MTKINLFFTVFLLNLVPLPASAMFTRMRSAFKPFAAATVRQLASPKLAKLAIGVGTLYGASHVRSVHALEDQKQNFTSELPDLEKYPELHKFFKKHQCSEEVRKTLEKERDNIQRVGFMGIYRYNNVPFYSKPIDDGFERVYNAWRMKRIFNDHDITTVALPDKCLCSIGNEWRMIASAITHGPAKKFSKKEMQEVVTVDEQTGYGDWHEDNVVRNQDGTLTIIDTENLSFEVSRPLPGFLLTAGLDEGVIDDAWRTKWADNTPNASVAHRKQFEQEFELWLVTQLRDDVSKKWFEERMQKAEADRAVFKENNLVTGSRRKYDDPDINFEQVKKEFKPWEEEMAKQKSQQ